MSKEKKINELKTLLNQPPMQFDQLYYLVNGEKMYWGEVEGNGLERIFANFDSVATYLKLCSTK